MTKGRTVNAMTKGRTVSAMTKGRTVNVMTKGRTVNVMTKGRIVNAMTKGRTVNAMTKGKKDKTTNSDTQNTTQKRLNNTRISQKPGDEVRCPGMINNPCSTSSTRHVTVKRHEHHLIWKSCWT